MITLGDFLLGNVIVLVASIIIVIIIVILIKIAKGACIWENTLRSKKDIS